MSGVTVIVPNWNRRELLVRLLSKLRVQTRRPEDVLVVDGGSTDGSADAAQSAGARVIRLAENAGFSRAVNVGIQSAGTPWLAVVNNDVVPAADWLERLIEAAERKDAWFACGKLLEEGRQDRVEGTFDLICRGGCPWRAGQGRPDGPLWRELRPVRLPPLTATLLRRELFEKVGLLDERLGSYLEDVDFGLRCADKGLEGIYVPEAVAFHAGSATLGAWHPFKVRSISRNQVLLVAKHYPDGWFRNYGWAVFVAQALWGLLAARHGRGFSWLAGKWEGLRQYRGMRRRKGDREAAAFSRFLEDSEAELFRLQRQAGFDLYWKGYFALT